MSIIYEVNLKIDNAIAGDFSIWLKEHIKEMCTFDGFIEASCYTDHENSTDDLQCMVVAYLLQDLSYYERYVNEHAPRMRAEGISLFGEGLQATRRILHQEYTIL